MASLVKKEAVITATIKFSEAELLYLQGMLQNRLVEKESSEDAAIRRELFETIRVTLLDI